MINVEIGKRNLLSFRKAQPLKNDRILPPPMVVGGE